MPIRPENQPLYPPNWREISIDIRQGRAGGRCEQCGVPNRVWRNHRTGRWTHDAGLAVYVYTVDEPSEMRRLLALGVDGLFTNHPDRMRALVDGDRG